MSFTPTRTRPRRHQVDGELLGGDATRSVRAGGVRAGTVRAGGVRAGGVRTGTARAGGVRAGIVRPAFPATGAPAGGAGPVVAAERVSGGLPACLRGYTNRRLLS